LSRINPGIWNNRTNIEGVVEFAVGQQSGIAGDLGAEEVEPETAVELRSKRLGWAVTHEVAHQIGRKWSETPEFAGFWRNCHADSGSSSGKSGV
jgi:hypothetical protein